MAFHKGVCIGAHSPQRHLPVIDIAPMPDSHDHDQEDIVGDGVDDAVITDADAKTGSPPKRARRRWARILSEERDGTLDAPANRRIELLQRANRSRAQLDAIAHVQPRSALT